VARDATARLYDVDADAVELDIKTGRITFRARKGRLVDLDKLHESIWATRLSGGTGMALNWIDVTATGDLARDQGKLLLRVPGTGQHFVLRDAPKPRAGPDGKTPLERLRQALDRGERAVSVTGRLEGWSGHFPAFLKALPPRPRVIQVQEFQTAGP
jgi:hypothetical protein